ncbi:hypothetical protein EV383_1742 [Pseudonocardia sediminis]|uniref:Uncharacterized protein n=1 Tax=Pseudonocardia sediminis TaxID=1397368 RepID=A0A4Q7UT33_PSEST|nr:hypothetical protein [Pseudonocardia sediminis]RZT84885.1 hypothetical protein EV383_1742 [Pseudonocardia sediminis]
MPDAHDGLVPALVRVGQQKGQLRWFRVIPRTGEWVNHAPRGWPRDDYEVEWVLHWAWDPDEPVDERPEVTVEICLVEPE